MNSALFLKLLKTRLVVAHHYLATKIINVFVWSTCSLVVFGYVMQLYGLIGDFGVFMLAGIVATVGLMEIYYNVAAMIMDFEGERSIEYYLTLPAKSSLVLMSIICTYAYVGMILSTFILLLGKIIFFTQLDFSNIAWGKLLLITLLGHFFYGISSLAIAAYIGKTAKLGTVWSRFLFPLWYLGGFQFSWLTIYKANATFSYILLINPIFYLVEGTRAAIMGQEGYISWWICIAALLAFTLILWGLAKYFMKKRLDCV